MANGLLGRPGQVVREAALIDLPVTSLLKTDPGHARTRPLLMAEKIVKDDLTTSSFVITTLRVVWNCIK